MTRGDLRIGLIWAEAHNGVIGYEGTMPWTLPEDLAHFKATTLGSAVIMGRSTWSSLPENVRPLPGRQNIVLSRDPVFAAPGAYLSKSLPAAISRAAFLAPEADTVWVIGGGAIYLQAIGLADEIIVTEIDKEFRGDTFSPGVGPRFTEDGETPEWRTSAAGLRYRFRRYLAIGANSPTHQSPA